MTYQDHTAELLLAEVAKSHDPPLAFEKIVEALELDVFVRCCKEDLDILDVQVGLQVKYPGKPKTENKPEGQKEAMGQDEAKVRGPFIRRMTWYGHN